MWVVDVGGWVVSIGGQVSPCLSMCIQVYTSIYMEFYSRFSLLFLFVLISYSSLIHHLPSRTIHFSSDTVPPSGATFYHQVACPSPPYPHYLSTFKYLFGCLSSTLPFTNMGQSVTETTSVSA